MFIILMLLLSYFAVLFLHLGLGDSWGTRPTSPVDNVAKELGAHLLQVRILFNFNPHFVPWKLHACFLINVIRIFVVRSDVSKIVSELASTNQVYNYIVVIISSIQHLHLSK